MQTTEQTEQTERSDNVTVAKNAWIYALDYCCKLRYTFTIGKIYLIKHISEAYIEPEITFMAFTYENVFDMVLLNNDGLKELEAGIYEIDIDNNCDMQFFKELHVEKGSVSVRYTRKSNSLKIKYLTYSGKSIILSANVTKINWDELAHIREIINRFTSFSDASFSVDLENMLPMYEGIYHHKLGNPQCLALYITQDGEPTAQCIKVSDVRNIGKKPDTNAFVISGDYLDKLFAFEQYFIIFTDALKVLSSSSANISVYEMDNKLYGLYMFYSEMPGRLNRLLVHYVVFNVEKLEDFVSSLPESNNKSEDLGVEYPEDSTYNTNVPTETKPEN